MQIHPVAAEQFGADRQTEKYDEANGCFLLFYEPAKVIQIHSSCSFKILFITQNIGPK